MPQQEVFFEQINGERRIEVLKTYDLNYAREAFCDMDDAAQNCLWNSLKIDDNYEVSDIPPRDTPETQDFLWEELLEAAREDGDSRSFFVVKQVKGSRSENLYVSPDWPSAEAFAKTRLSART